MVLGGATKNAAARSDLTIRLRNNFVNSMAIQVRHVETAIRRNRQAVRIEKSNA